MTAPLPIDPVLPEIARAVRAARAAVIVAAPGAGKTTRVPPALLAAGLLQPEHPQLLMLQPRRVAARAAAARIAEENNWMLGREVGYQVRLERVMENQTPLRVITEGILTRQLLEDPFLPRAGAVILDEFHERSIHTDLALALLREVRQSVRPDLILIVMSASLDAQPVADFLGGCPVIECPGRTFEIRIEHHPPTGSPITDRMAAEIESVLRQPPSETGDVLAFLPGAAEIHQVQRQIKSSDLILPLYGSLPFEEQLRALRPADRRRVILSTNIAETSLTIPGVRTVIDSGLARRASYDSQRGLDQLQLTRISQASAAQRAGRAGRTAPGRCIRLWTLKEHAELLPFDPPEIQRVDLSSTVLALHSWGRAAAGRFGWFQPPPADLLASADRLLWMLGALDSPSEGQMTPLGRRLMEIPAHPRLARLLIAAADAGFPRQGANLAALLSERDSSPASFAAPTHGQSDLTILLDRPMPSQTARLARNLERLAPRAAKSKVATESELMKLILLAYPDRVCRRRGTSDTALMTGNIGVRLARESAVRTAEFFVAVDVRRDDRSARGEALVCLASAIKPEWLAECFPNAVTRETTEKFDEKRSAVVGLTREKYLDLILSESSGAAVQTSRASGALAAALRPRAAEIFAADESAAQLLARVDFLRRAMPEQNWPEFSAETLADILTEACEGRRTIEEVKKHSLSDFLMRRLPYPLDRALNQNAPASLTLPNGKPIRLRYEPGRAPVLAAKLQELFGLTQTPRLAGGRVPIVLEILGPNYRPVQITDDLASFWATTYFQVRKDLKRRYPKHAWPDDPTTAKPRTKK